MPRPDRLVGVWSTDYGPIGLGGLLTLLAELGALRKIHQVATVDVQLQVRTTLGKNAASLADAVLPHVQGIDSFRRVESFEVTEEAWQWPDDPAHHDYQSSATLQRLYAAHGVGPELHMSVKLVDWADSWLRRHSSGTWPVVMHLKNNQHADGESNANFSAWRSFLADCAALPVTFVLIGNEYVDKEITRLENTVVTSDFELSLAQELALVERASAFMGMSSGPCNMAIFSRVPYAIFKNPDHHATEMGRELGENNHFSFASASQRFLRQRETRDLLFGEFSRLHSYAQAAV